MKNGKDTKPETADFEAIYREFRTPLLRFVRSKVKDEHLAEDLLQDIFVKASRSLESLKDANKIQSWLFSIASNCITDHYRKRQLPLTDEADAVQESENEPVLRELACCIEPFLEALPMQQKEAMKGIYMEELTQQEYASLNKLNLSTVKSQVKRGKSAMRKFFESCCDFERNQHNEVVDFKGRHEKE